MFGNRQVVKRALGIVASIMIVAPAVIVAQNTFPATGNVGIGTTTPQGLLDVNGGAVFRGYLNIYYQGSTFSGYLGSGASLFFSGTNGQSDIGLRSSGNVGVSGGNATTPQFVVSSTGNVGIGTTTPAYGLDVGVGSNSWSSWNSWAAPQIASNVLTGPGVQKVNARASMYAAVAARNPGIAFSVYMVPWDGVNNLETNCNSQINAGWHAQGAVKGNYFSQPFDNNDFTQYSSLVLSQADFDSYKSVGTQWWVGCSTLPSYSNGQWNAAGSNITYSAGNVGIGTSSPGAKLEVDGSVKLTSDSGASLTYADGTTQSTAWTGVLCGGDYAEAMNAAGSKKAYEPGDVLVLASGKENDVEKSAEPYSTMVAGIYATKPGVIGRRQSLIKDYDALPMAMVGVVPTKVSAENGPIRKGDLLVTSSLSGYAMKGTDRSRMLGAVIGKAMGSLDTGTGLIEVLVTLQ